LLAEETEADTLIDRYDVPRKEANGLLHLVRRLHTTFPAVEPSAAFRRRLKDELVGVPQGNLVRRWRTLPARVQVAASFAVAGGFLGGFLLILWQRLAWLARKGDVEEVTAM
jgi:type VI protein secretion system component VasF